MKLTYQSFDLQLKEVFTIAHGSRTVQPTMIVQLEQDGVTGLGEATATKYYGLTVEGMAGKLEAVRTLVEKYTLSEPEAFWRFLYPHLENDPFVLCALDEAAHDLYAKTKKAPLYQLWGLKAENLPLTNYTIGIASVAEMVEKIKAQPWPIYKIKLGTDHDLDIVRALREHTHAVFRVDANTGWTPGQTVVLSDKLQNLGVEFIEQPLPADDWAGMKYVFRKSKLPVMADESCQVETDVARCKGHFHGVNIKLMKCGGLTPARRMIQTARELGLQTMVGCMTESSVGIAAIAHLLPLLDYVDMDGALLLKNDPAEGVTIDQGRVTYADRPGTGARLIEK